MQFARNPARVACALRIQGGQSVERVEPTGFKLTTLTA